MKKPLLYILPFLLLSSLAWAESELPACEGSPTQDNTILNKWIDCQGTMTYADGRKYVGEWKDGKRHGQGTGIRFDGAKYVGEWKGGKPHGQGTSTFPEGAKYVGEFKDGERHGQGTMTYPDGTILKGTWERDTFPLRKNKIQLPEACEGSPVTHILLTKEWTNCQGTYTWASGRYVGEFKDGKYHGQGTVTWPNGTKYVGGWKDGKEHGQGTYTWSDGKKYVGEYKDGKRHGQGAEVYPDGKVVKGIWKDGELFEVQ